MKQTDNKKSQTQSPVKVVIRVRPIISLEKNTIKIVHVETDEHTVQVHVDEYNDIQTKFDKAMDDYKTQREVFDYLSPDIQQVFDGYNMTIFAYGQTGSGKTFTMFGRDWQNNFDQNSKIKKQSTSLTNIPNDQNTAGIIPRCAHLLFQKIEQFPDQFNIFCSFLQIYNEKIYDLLHDTPHPHSLHIHQSKFDGVFVEGLGQFQVSSYLDIIELVGRGQRNRNIRQTSMNAKSSRSHTVFQILIESIKPKEDGTYIKVKLNLCDLAGSQKINKKEQMATEHLSQLKNINLSLTTLGKVIKSLSTGDTKLRSSFRQSKLTRILQDSLVGNTKTFIIGAVSPSSKNVEETMNTLKFVQRARHIKMKVKPTSINSNNAELVKKLQLELEHMRKLLIQKSKQKTEAEVNEEMKMLMWENSNLKNLNQNQHSSFEELMNENRQMKVALHRLELIAMADFSQNYSNQTKSSRSITSYNRHDTPMKKSKSPREEKKKQIKQVRQLSQYSQLQSRKSKRESILPMLGVLKQSTLEPIEEERGQKLNRSLEGEVPKKKKQRYDRANEKRSIIKKLQNIEQIQKSHEQNLLKDLSTIQKQNKSDEFKNKKTLREEDRMSERKSGRRKGKKTDYADKIRELEIKLMKRF